MGSRVLLRQFLSFNFCSARECVCTESAMSMRHSKITCWHWVHLCVNMRKPASTHQNVDFYVFSLTRGTWPFRTYSAIRSFVCVFSPLLDLLGSTFSFNFRCTIAHAINIIIGYMRTPMHAYGGHLVDIHGAPHSLLSIVAVVRSHRVRLCSPFAHISDISHISNEMKFWVNCR